MTQNVVSVNVGQCNSGVPTSPVFGALSSMHGTAMLCGWSEKTMEAARSLIWCKLQNPSLVSRQNPFLCQFQSWVPLRFTHSKGLGLCSKGNLFQSRFGEVGAVYGSKEGYLSFWDDKPFEVLPSGKRVYLDEQDVVTFLDPPMELIPLDPTSYNPAAYLWKKLEDIPEERRHQLLQLLKPELISRAWQIAGTRYEDRKFAKKTSSKLLSGDDHLMLEYYNCRTSGGKAPIAWINFFKKAIFSTKEGKAYGRIIGGPVLGAFANSFCPLYFITRDVKEVMSTEQPCDLAYEFGNGIFDIQEFPQGFPRPVKHPYPFNDHVVIYVRLLGPGVLVGQAWQEGRALEQVPRKLCGEILMVKQYAMLQQN